MFDYGAEQQGAFGGVVGFAGLGRLGRLFVRWRGRLRLGLQVGMVAPAGVLVQMLWRTLHGAAPVQVVLALSLLLLSYTGYPLRSTAPCYETPSERCRAYIDACVSSPVPDAAHMDAGCAGGGAIIGARICSLQASKD